MFNWKSLNTCYCYDGTFQGLLTIVFLCYVQKSFPMQIISSREYQSTLLYEVINIKTDENRAKRIFNGMVKNISFSSLYHAYYAFLNQSKGKELSILKYICYGFLVGPQIDTMLSIDFVFHVHQMQKQTLGECHRLKGLVRFMELDNTVFYSTIHPNHNILEPLGQHFMRRLPSQNFMIHDKNRNLIFLYHFNKYQITTGIDIQIPTTSEEEKLYQELWKTFFTTISIKERKNARCQMQYMPKKYWKDLTEFQK